MTSVLNIEIVDVSARDGLQNESRSFSTSEKVQLIQLAIEAGARRLEVASFAHPKYVPQMADAEDVIASLPDKEGLEYIGLVMNERGLDRALATNIGEVGLVCMTTNSFAKKNQNQTRAESIKIACAAIERARAAGRKANVTIGAAFGCPFEGEVDIQTVVDMAALLASSGPREISVADTIGVGNPWHVTDLIHALKSKLPNMPLRAHFHNTRNTGLANAFAAVKAGVKTLDVSIGGIGGCPFAPAATGNIPAEDVVYMLERGGVDTGYDLDGLIKGANWLSKKLETPLPSMLPRAGQFPSQ